LRNLLKRRAGEGDGGDCRRGAWRNRGLPRQSPLSPFGGPRVSFVFPRGLQRPPSYAGQRRFSRRRFGHPSLGFDKQNRWHQAGRCRERAPSRSAARNATEGVPTDALPVFSLKTHQERDRSMTSNFTSGLRSDVSVFSRVAARLRWPA
jgi:hypothetical protein